MLSVPPESMYGIGCPSGSSAAIAAFMASTRLPENGYSSGGDHTHSISIPSPTISAICSWKCSSEPGSTRQSTVAWAVDGITLAL